MARTRKRDIGPLDERQWAYVRALKRELAGYGDRPERAAQVRQEIARITGRQETRPEGPPETAA